MKATAASLLVIVPLLASAQESRPSPEAAGPADAPEGAAQVAPPQPERRPARRERARWYLGFGAGGGPAWTYLRALCVGVDWT